MISAILLAAGQSKRMQGENKLLKKYKKKATGQLRRYLITPEQEYVEAACLIAIVEKKDIPSDKKLAVMPESYVLGLLEFVGELKRKVFYSDFGLLRSCSSCSFLL